MIFVNMVIIAQDVKKIIVVFSPKILHRFYIGGTLYNIGYYLYFFCKERNMSCLIYKKNGNKYINM